MSRPARIRIGRRLVSPASHAILPPAVGVAVIVLNAQTSLFAGALPTQPAFLALLPAVAVLAAVAFVAAWRGLHSRRAVVVALVGGFLGALLATTPMAWNSPAVFGVENVTTTDEFQALALLSSLGARNVTTDQRLADVATMWFGYTTDKSLPLKLRDNESVAGFAYALVLERWTTVGAQEHPAPNVVLLPVVLVHFLESNRVVYVAGPPGDRVFLLQILG